MLKKLVPEGTILKNVRTEIYDGKTTFARQIGTYPLIVGIKGRIPLNKFVNVKVTGYMLRSIVGEVI
jgi:radical SAM superfamily enzyme with C-terminal helix-hairpin-helix motif